MISGTRNPPPISTSSPRDTITDAPARQRREHEQHRGRVVVHDDARLRAARFREQRARVLVARAAHTFGEPVFEVGVPAASAIAATLAERRAPEVRVQQHAGRVDDRPEQLRENCSAWARASAITVSASIPGAARGGDGLARDAGSHRVGQRRIEPGEHPLDAGKAAPGINHVQQRTAAT